MSAISADSSTRIRASSLVSAESLRALAMVPVEFERTPVSVSTSARMPLTTFRRVESFRNRPTLPPLELSIAAIESFADKTRVSLVSNSAPIIFRREPRSELAISALRDAFVRETCGMPERLNAPIVVAGELRRRTSRFELSASFVSRAPRLSTRAAVASVTPHGLLTRVSPLRTAGAPAEPDQK